MSLDLLDALRQIEREKDIPAETLVRTIEASLVSAYRKNYGGSGDIRVEIDFQHGSFHVFARRTVVEVPEADHSEIALNEAQRYRPEVKAGEIIEFEVTPENFGRIAAQTAKQVMMQRLREAERERIFDEFCGREGELVTGEVQRRERRNLCVNVGRVEALLPPSEQVEGEEYRLGQHLKFYILEVRKTTRSPQVVLSRSHPGLVKRLFELEVPEMHEGVVELKGVSRHAGSRSKIAVHSNDANVDPVGACVGHRGSRVQAVVEELSGEKIDIIRWSPEITEFIASSLSPAKVPKVVLSEPDRTCTVVVPEDQLSLAIGKSGQNVRLAARLTGYRIDIRSEDQWAAEHAESPAATDTPAEAAGADGEATPPEAAKTSPAPESAAESAPAADAETEAAAVPSAEETSPEPAVDSEAEGAAEPEPPAAPVAEETPSAPSDTTEAAPVEPAEPAESAPEAEPPAPAGEGDETSVPDSEQPSEPEPPAAPVEEETASESSDTTEAASVEPTEPAEPTKSAPEAKPAAPAAAAESTESATVTPVELAEPEGEQPVAGPEQEPAPA